MKIFGINFGRKKKIKAKKERVNPANLNYTASFFETSNTQDSTKTTNDKLSDTEEISLPEKSNVDIDDNAQIGFIPDEQLSNEPEPFYPDTSSDNENALSSHPNEDNWTSVLENLEVNSIQPTSEDKILTDETKNFESSSQGPLTPKINELNNIILELQSEVDELDKIILNKKDTVTRLEDQIDEITSELNNKTDQKNSLLKNLDKEKEEKLNQLDALINQKTLELQTITNQIELKSEELKRVDENYERLVAEKENQLNDKISELDSIINRKTEHISKLDYQLRNLTEEFERKKLETQNWEEQNKSNLETIEKSKAEILELEKRIIEIHTEAKELLSTKNEIYSEILKLQEELKQLKSEKEKTAELIQLAQKRREEIEFSNDQIEKRLLRMIQKFDDEIKELSSYKSQIEKNIAELQSKIIENENIIAERLNNLQETEDKLRLRQTELSAINNLISNLNEKEDHLSKSISDYELEIARKKNDNQELRKEIELFTQKKHTIEKMLEELLISSQQRISNLLENYQKTENEIRNKEIIYEDLNQKIDKAIDELVELQKSVQEQKVEFEDLKIKSENLKKLNQSLENEIVNNNRILEQFKKMKEEISAGSVEMRKDFSKEFGINKEELNTDLEQKKIFRLK